MKNLILLLTLSFLVFNCNSDSAEMEEQLALAVSVRGKVSCVNHNPIPDAIVSISNNELLVLEVTTDENGEYNVQDLEPGEYSITLSSSTTPEYVEDNFEYYDNFELTNNDQALHERIANDINIDGAIDIFDLIMFRQFYEGSITELEGQTWHFYNSSEIESNDILSIDEFNITIEDGVESNLNLTGVFTGDPKGFTCN